MTTSTHLPRQLLVAVPLVISVLLAGWLLWVRAEPRRQGGWCSNATLAVADLLNDAGTTAEAGTGDGALAKLLLPYLDDAAVERLAVATPPEVAGPVDVLAAADLPPGRNADPALADAFGAVLADYQRRCLYQG